LSLWLVTAGGYCLRSLLAGNGCAVCSGGSDGAMGKMLRCGDLIPGCKAVLEGRDADEVLIKAAEHARKEHAMKALPPELLAKARTVINDR
jgi:predicted small metal-binding protein